MLAWEPDEPASSFFFFCFGRYFWPPSNSDRFQVGPITTACLISGGFDTMTIATVLNKLDSVFSLKENKLN